MIGFDLDPAQLRAHPHGGEKDDVADRAGERGDAVVFRQADRDADGEEQRQIAEDRVARFRHDLRDAFGQPREVGAADAEQNARDRQHRDRQHHALADLLEEREGVFEVEHEFSLRFRERARGLPRPWRTAGRAARGPGKSLG